MLSGTGTNPGPPGKWSLNRGREAEKRPAKRIRLGGGKKSEKTNTVHAIFASLSWESVEVAEAVGSSQGQGVIFATEFLWNRSSAVATKLLFRRHRTRIFDKML